MKKVVIVQHRLLHYRTSFFESLRRRCAASSIDLRLVHGLPTRREEAKRDAGFLPWADVVTNRVVEIGPRDLLWQPFPAHLRDAELVVLMQENRLISNYPWLFKFPPRKTRVAFWGHGRNFQSKSPRGVREKWKKLLVNRVDWWFAYTQVTMDILVEDGYPPSKISVLQNAIDNEMFSRDLASVSGEALSLLRADLGIASGSHVGLFCGSLYADKRIEFMIEALDRIRAQVPDFHMVVVGDGPNAAEIATAVETRPWMSWVGPKKGVEKAPFFRLASVVLNPGAVGLHVLDAFCAGIPMATTVDARHGPEIAYLNNGVNGVISAGNPIAFADDVVALLEDKVRYASICSAAKTDAGRFTMANMVDRFHEGILKSLALPSGAQL